MAWANRSFHSYFFQNEFYGEFIAFRFSRYGFYSLFDLYLKRLITGAQPKAGTGLKMQTVRFFNVTLLGIYR